MEDFRRKLLGVGCPRSGSRFLTKVLRNAGVNVGHEHVKPDGLIGMFFAVEDVWYPGKHYCTEDESKQKRSDYTFEQVWHYTRDPRRAIPSIASDYYAQNLWCWTERHTGISAGLYPKKLRAMQFWVAWNDRIEKNEEIDFRLPIEEIDSLWDEIKDRLGLSDDAVVPDAIPRDYGSVKDEKMRPALMTWDEMKSLDADVAGCVREMAERYGYE